LLHWAQHSQNDNPATGEKTVKSSDPVAASRRVHRRLSRAGGLDRGGIGALFAQPALIALTVVLVVLCGTALVAGVGERRSGREGSTASEGMKGRDR